MNFDNILIGDQEPQRSFNERPPVSQQLPFDARMALVRAAQTPIPPGDPLARVKAIEQAQALARRRFPDLFQHVQDPER